MAITRISNIANTLPDDSISNSKLQNIVNFKNIIINGDMSIAQRGTSTASITTTGYYTVDRFQADVTNIGTWTQSQSTDTPTGQGFATSLKMDCTTADASPAAGDLLRITQRIEGQNIQYLKKGTANAESVTLSFWVKSNKTGTYIAELFDDNSRSISKSYTVNTTNTWEKKTIIYEGDTTGTIDNDNTIGLSLHLWLAAGSTYTSGTLNTSWNSVISANRAVGQVNFADSTSNDFWITGIQLEAGTTASDFEFLPFDLNLERCMRYYEKSYDVTTAIGTNTGRSLGAITNRVPVSAPGGYSLGCWSWFKIKKRATPTVAVYNSVSGASGSVRQEDSGSADISVGTYGQTVNGFNIYNNTGSGFGSAETSIGWHYTASAEL